MTVGELIDALSRFPRHQVVAVWTPDRERCEVVRVCKAAVVVPTEAGDFRLSREEGAAAVVLLSALEVAP